MARAALASTRSPIAYGTVAGVIDRVDANRRHAAGVGMCAGVKMVEAFAPVALTTLGRVLEKDRFRKRFFRRAALTRTIP